MEAYAREAAVGDQGGGAGRMTKPTKRTKADVLQDAMLWLSILAVIALIMAYPG
jgi:hypothetical protein